MGNKIWFWRYDFIFCAGNSDFAANADNAVAAEGLIILAEAAADQSNGIWGGGPVCDTVRVFVGECADDGARVHLFPVLTAWSLNFLQLLATIDTPIYPDT